MFSFCFTQGSVQKVTYANPTKVASKKKVGTLNVTLPTHKPVKMKYRKISFMRTMKNVFSTWCTFLFLFYVTLQDEEKGVDMGDGLEEWSHGKALIKPSDQLELTEAVSRWGSSLSLRHLHGLWWGNWRRLCCCCWVLFFFSIRIVHSFIIFFWLCLQLLPLLNYSSQTTCAVLLCALIYL